MTTSLVFYAFFSVVDTGVAGLTVTVDLDAINRGTGARTVVATGASATEGRNGVYSYRYDADLASNDYIANFHTNDATVDYKDIASVWQDTTNDTILAVQYTSGASGATGLTATVDVDFVNRNTGVWTPLSTGIAATEGRDGIYFLRVASPDLIAGDIIAAFKTTDVTVEYKTILSGAFNSALVFAMQPDPIVPAGIRVVSVYQRRR